MEISPIARIQSDFNEKFGIPRQSGLVPELTARIVFEKNFRRPEALKAIEGFSHLWLIWQFSETLTDTFRPTVRPPRLGGNDRVGVFASRSPYRPNGLGLSCVKLLGVDYTCADAPVLLVGGADLLSGTPIYDIKPYIPLSDCHPEALPGYTAITKEHKLEASCPDDLKSLIPKEKLSALLGVLECDPRPGYEEQSDEAYGLSFAGLDIGFEVHGSRARICRVGSVHTCEKL